MKVDELDGEIRVNLLDSSASPPVYVVNSDAQSGTVAVSDDDTPIISVVGNGEVVEGIDCRIYCFFQYFS